MHMAGPTVSSQHFIAQKATLGFRSASVPVHKGAVFGEQSGTRVTSNQTNNRRDVIADK